MTEAALPLLRERVGHPGPACHPLLTHLASVCREVPKARFLTHIFLGPEPHSTILPLPSRHKGTTEVRAAGFPRGMVPTVAL